MSLRREKPTMKLSNALSTLRVVSIAFGMIVVFGIPTFGQEAPLQKEASAPQLAPAMNEVLRHNIENWALQGRGIPEDWSHHHLVFSNPGTEEDAIANGTHDRWLSIVNDPRYIIQQLKRRAAQGPAAADIASIESIAATQDPTPAAKRKKKSKLKKDWSEPLGSGAAASASGTFTGAPTATQTVKITDGSNTLTLTATASTHTGTVNNTTSNGATTNDTVTVGTVIYEFAASQSGCSGTYNVCVWWGNNNIEVAESLEAAINNIPAECPGFVSGTWGSTCYTVVTAGDAPNPAASATHSGSHTYVTVTNLTYTALALATDDTSDFSLNGGGSSTSSISQVASCSSSTTGTLIIDGNSTSQQAANLAGAIAACDSSYPTFVGVTATASGATVTVTATTVGPGGNSIEIPETLSNFTWANSATTLSGGGIATVQPNMYPAVYVASFTSASCSDFAVYPTGQAGSASAANIIAYSHLYTGGCTDPVPSVYWAYNTGAYAVTTSPILSVDGKQIAFMESNGATASLVLIKWAAETGESVTAPLTLTNLGSGSAYRSCTPTASAPCMFTIAFINGNNDTLSAPFYDFAGSDDVLYVGDDSGNLHKFTGVFAGKPGESGNPWTNLGTNKLSSPVYDSNSGHIRSEE